MNSTTAATSTRTSTICEWDCQSAPGGEPGPSLTHPERAPLLSCMVAKIAQDGKIALPEQVREQADLNPGDTLNIQVYKGTIVLRKNQALSPEECAALLEQSRLQP